MKPFDKVLVRNAEYGLWIPSLFGMEKVTNLVDQILQDQ
jgi:hypothetical protein